jgi:exodeoxyribonuclease VII small subunit
MAEESKSFEESVARLDAIVKQMEQGNVPLEQALALFQEGTELVRKCSGMLDQAELQIVRLMKSADGSPAETEFVRDE